MMTIVLQLLDCSAFCQDSEEIGGSGIDSGAPLI